MRVVERSSLGSGPHMCTNSFGFDSNTKTSDRCDLSKSFSDDIFTTKQIAYDKYPYATPLQLQLVQFGFMCTYNKIERVEGSFFIADVVIVWARFVPSTGTRLYGYHHRNERGQEIKTRDWL